MCSSYSYLSSSAYMGAGCSISRYLQTFLPQTSPSAALISPSISCSVLPSLMNRTPSYLNLRQKPSSNRNRPSHLTPVENHNLGLGGADLLPDHFALGCKLPEQNIVICKKWCQILCHWSAFVSSVLIFFCLSNVLFMNNLKVQGSESIPHLSGCYYRLPHGG